MKYKLFLKQHCIETEIKKRYNKSISDYFKAGRAAGALEEQIELFREALETFDFGELRSRHPALRGNSDAVAILCKDQAGRLHITINEEDIEP